MRIIISPKAEKILRKLPKIDQIAVAKKIRFISQIKELSQEEKLKGYRDIYRVRLGDYRIIYRRIPSEIYIVLIGHRKNIYDLLKHLFN